MKIRIIIFLLILFAACKRQQLSEDEKFKEWFSKRIEVVDQHYKTKIYDNEFLEATTELYAITGIRPQAEIKMFSDFLNIPDSLVYSKRNYYKDKRRWKRWYNKNKYKMSLSKVDSILRSKYKGEISE